MKSNINLLSIILIFISIPCLESTIFCDSKGKSLVDAVFNLKNEIYLIRGEDVWILKTLSDNRMPDPISLKVEQKFKGLEIKHLMTGFTVESVPMSCDKSLEEEKCLFIDYMLNSVFIFYKKATNLRQIYSMIKFNQNEYNYIFDDQIGGYGYQLRANRTVVRSSWPGITPDFNEIIATLFVADKNQIVLYTRNPNNGQTFISKKHLDEEWDVPVVSTQFTRNGKIIGAFRKRDKYYLAFDSGFIHEIISLDTFDFDGLNYMNDTTFFGCQ